MQIELVQETVHEDGGATYTFDMTGDASKICGELGLKLLLYCGILEKSPSYVFELLSKEIDAMLEKTNEIHKSE